MRFVIDAMTLEDWPQVRAIYVEGLVTNQATFETEAPTWEQWDVGHLPSCRLTVRMGEVVLGWAALSPVSRRECYAGVAEVSVYVGAAHRGQGVGKALLQALITASERQGLWTLQGATFAQNKASLRLGAIQEQLPTLVLIRLRNLGKIASGIGRSSWMAPYR
jgi:L-amino acid N-acyltransferase YncA